MSIFPKRYSFLVWKPEPEVLSSDNVRSCPLSSIFPRPSPQVMSTSCMKLPANAVAMKHASRDAFSNVAEEEAEEAITATCENEKSRRILWELSARGLGPFIHERRQLA